MASFAPGTSQQYMKDYYSRVGPSLGGSGPEVRAPQRAVPTRQNSVVVSGGRVSPYSPQASTRPFQGTLRPVAPNEGASDALPASPRASRSAGTRWNGTSWSVPATARMGRAMPVEPQGQGTPYGSPMPTEPGLRLATPASGPSAGGWPEIPMAGSGWDPSYLTMRRPASETIENAPFAILKHLTPPEEFPGNFANMPPSMRPAPFTQATLDFKGQPADPTQLFAKRDAFVQAINDARAPLAMQAGMGMGGQPPQRNIGQLWSQAGEMVNSGYQNPFAAAFGMAAQSPSKSAGDPRLRSFPGF